VVALLPADAVRGWGDHKGRPYSRQFWRTLSIPSVWLTQATSIKMFELSPWLVEALCTAALLQRPGAWPPKPRFFVNHLNETADSFAISLGFMCVRPTCLGAAEGHHSNAQPTCGAMCVPIVREVFTARW
jgi:hypothetical protein